MRKVQQEQSFNGHDLTYSEKNYQGFYVEMLERIDSLLKDATSQHKRIFFIMFVLKYPEGSALKYPDDNALLSKFIDTFMRYYKRNNCDPSYLWARERSTTGQYHYHFVLLLDSNYVQNGYGVLARATKVWGNCLGIEDGAGLVHLCTTGIKCDHHNGKKCDHYTGDNCVYYNGKKCVHYTDTKCDRYGGVKIIRGTPEFPEVYGKCFERSSYIAKCYSKGDSAPNLNEYGSSRRR